MPDLKSHVSNCLLTTCQQIDNNNSKSSSLYSSIESNLESQNPSLSITYRLITQLSPNPQNARTHSKAQIRKIAESIREFGFTNPVLIDRNDMIVAGCGRVGGAKLLGMNQVPTIRLESLTPAQVRAYVLADNRLAEDAGWDKQILKIELQNLVLSTEIDVSLTGFEIAEVDQILRIEDPVEDDELPAVTGPAVSRPGDLWLLGKHRILCGDARDESAFSRLMENERASVVYTDPRSIL